VDVAAARAAIATPPAPATIQRGQGARRAIAAASFIASIKTRATSPKTIPARRSLRISP
jgi:hypothetical protein